MELDSLSQKVEKLKHEKNKLNEQLTLTQSEFQKADNTVKSLQDELRSIKESKLKLETALDVKSQLVRGKLTLELISKLNRKSSELSQMADLMFSLKQELEYYKINHGFVGDINEFGGWMAWKGDPANSLERESVFLNSESLMCRCVKKQHHLFLRNIERN